MLVPITGTPLFENTGEAFKNRQRKSKASAEE
jgi:hypothetical protein